MTNNGETGMLAVLDTGNKVTNKTGGILGHTVSLGYKYEGT